MNKRCILDMWFALGYALQIKFLIVPMTLPFVLGMDMLQCYKAEVNIPNATLMMTMERRNLVVLCGSTKKSSALSVVMLSSLAVFDKLDMEVFACSTK